jgi:hypothetical protein
MKDAYELGVDYGVIEQAKDLGVKLNVVEAAATQSSISRSRRSRTASPTGLRPS